jgi:hypothetical protein
MVSTFKGAKPFEYTEGKPKIQIKRDLNFAASINFNLMPDPNHETYGSISADLK